MERWGGEPGLFPNLFCPLQFHGCPASSGSMSRAEEPYSESKGSLCRTESFPALALTSPVLRHVIRQSQEENHPAAELNLLR